MLLSTHLPGPKAYFSILINVTAQKEYVCTKSTFMTKNLHDTELHDHLPCFASTFMYRWDTKTNLLYVKVTKLL